jgi:hypothetical protein
LEHGASGKNPSKSRAPARSRELGTVSSHFIVCIGKYEAPLTAVGHG